LIERLASVAAQLRRFAREQRPPESMLDWPGGFHLTRLRPVKTRPGHITNKGGRIVLRGEHAGEQIKLYEAYTVEHAVFISALPGLEVIGGRFPAVIARHGRCVVTPWVEGTPPPDDVPVYELAKIQAALHAVSASRLPPAGYDFWLDFLRPRFMRAADMVGQPVDDIAASVDAEMGLPVSQRVLVHPDFRPANIVRDRTGKWVSIDNEYCTTSTLPLLDVVHTAHAFGSRAQDYWAAYLEGRGSTLSATTLVALQGAWLARLMGSAFVGGRIGVAARALRDYRSGRNLLPFAPHKSRA
jgi:hypothetical protein